MSKILDVKKTKIDESKGPDGKIIGSGSIFVFSHADNGSFIAINKILKEGGKINCALEDFTMDDKKYPKGSFLLETKSIDKTKLKEIAEETGITMIAGKTNVKTKKVRKNRIALYKGFTGSMDRGWTSYVLDVFEYQYHSLSNAEMKAGNLKQRFDVIIFADMRASSIINGNSKGSIHPDYVGGITENGVENLKKFVKEGGVLVCNKNSSDLAITEFKLPFRNILQKMKSDTFNCPGSILKVNYKTDNPIAFGMPENGTVYFSRAKVFEFIDSTKQDDPNTVVKKRAPGNEQAKPGSTAKKVLPEKKYKPELAKVDYKILAEFPDESLLLSGWIMGDELIRKKPIALDISFEKGKIILFGFNVHNRAQSYSTFKLLFNAIIY